MKVLMRRSLPVGKLKELKWNYLKVETLMN